MLHGVIVAVILRCLGQRCTTCGRTATCGLR